MCVETSVSAKLREALPAADNIHEFSDERLGELAEEVYRFFNSRRRVEPDGLLPEHVACVLEVYHQDLDAPEGVLSGVFSAMDPDQKGVATYDNFCDLFPVVMRLVQLRIESREALRRQAERMAEEAAKAEARKKDPKVLVETSARSYMKPTKTSQNKERPELPSTVSKSVPSMTRRSTLSEGPTSSSPQMSIAAISIPPREIHCFHKIFSEMDTDKDGLVTWEKINTECPSLPREPVSFGRLLGMDLDRQSQFDLPMLLRVLYLDITVADSKALAKLGYHDKEFVLPKDKKEEISDLFQAYDTANKKVLSPGALMQGLMRTGYDAEQMASAYATLLFEKDSSSGITLPQFQDWYIADVLSDAFKNAHMGRAPSTA